MAMTEKGLAFCDFASTNLQIPSRENPHIKPTMTAVESSKRKSGTIKVEAKTNLDKKVKIVDSQISFALC